MKAYPERGEEGGEWNTGNEQLTMSLLFDLGVYIYIYICAFVYPAGSITFPLSLSLSAENAIPVCDVSALDEIVAIKVGSLREILCGNVDN